MNPSQKLRALLLAGMLASSAIHAADPQPAPDMAALMALLNSLAVQSAEAAPASEAAPAEPAPPAPPAAPPAQAAPRTPPAPAPSSSALRTGSLATGSLTASGPLGGHGAGAAARLSEAGWRVLFQAKATRN